MRPDPPFGLLKLHDDALPHGYGYLLARRGDVNAGGRAGEPGRRPYGLIAECADDQGATFRLWQPAGGPGVSTSSTPPRFGCAAGR